MPDSAPETVTMVALAPAIESPVRDPEAEDSGAEEPREQSQAASVAEPVSVSPTAAPAEPVRVNAIDAAFTPLPVATALPAPEPNRGEPVSPPSAPDPAAVRHSYETQLWQHIAAHRPPGTRLRGTAILRFTLNAAGGLLSSSIERTSGDPILDRTALRTLRRAAPLPAPPSALGEGPFTFVIPFRFG